MKFKIGTRGSKLSLAQTNWVVDELKKKNQDSEFEIITIKTKGDTDARPLFTINQKGIFEKEIDKAVLDGIVDFAVHSLKDVPSQIADGLVLACVPKRESVNDVLISREGSNLQDLKSGAVVGTSSLRRAVQARKIRPDLVVKPIRGNIETRVNKIDENYDAVILAEAGISRLGLGVKYTKLSIDEFSPSPGQGALAIIARADSTDTVSMLSKIEDDDSRLEVEAERALSNVVESGCRFPVGAFAKSEGDKLSLKVVAFSVEGDKSIIVQKSGEKQNPKELGKITGEELKKQGVMELALNWRESVEQWNK